MFMTKDRFTPMLNFVHHSGWAPARTWMLPLLLLCGCGRQQPEIAAEVREAPLATVGDEIITEEDFEAEVRRRLEKGQPLADTRTVLRDMIERKAMLQKAAASDVARDPVVKREMENLLLRHWIERGLQVEKAAVKVSGEELREIYEADPSAWTLPAQTRLAMLYRRLDPHAPEEAVEKLKGALRDAVKEFNADRKAATRDGRIPGFGAVAAQASEDALSRYRGGDLGWMKTAATNETRWPPEMLETGFALEVGGVSKLLHLDDGLYVVMKTGRRQPRMIPFDEAAIRLRRRLLREKREAFEQEFMRRLLEEAHVEINPEKAAQLQRPVREPGDEPPALVPVEERMGMP